MNKPPRATTIGLLWFRSKKCKYKNWTLHITGKQINWKERLICFTEHKRGSSVNENMKRMARAFHRNTVPLEPVHTQNMLLMSRDVHCIHVNEKKKKKGYNCKFFFISASACLENKQNTEHYPQQCSLWGNCPWLGLVVWPPFTPKQRQLNAS